MYKIVVLMSTYNGGQYIREQVDSILNQHIDNMLLLVHDDGSTDKTLQILQEYETQYENVKILDVGHCGYPKCFFYLMKESPRAEYYAFCDQDDYWKPQKLFMAIEKIQNMHEPVLYCSQKDIVDSFLRKLSYQDTEPKPGILNAFLRRNQAFGCTMVYNDKLRVILNQYPYPNVPYHDSWTFKVTSLMGKFVYDNRSSMMYRQHGSNVAGANSTGWTLFKERISHASLKKFREARDPSHYAQEALNGYGEKIPRDKYEILKWITLSRENFSARMKLFLCSGLYPRPFYEWAWLKLRILLGWL